ncbi:MAG: transglutaminase family protein [Chitinophagales bacterium]|nr:transglutaminase family protein [Chitinophagales bacterium]
MELIIESVNLKDYLQEDLPIIEWNTPAIQKIIQDIEDHCETPFEKAKMAFEYARDQIRHSFDTQYLDVSITAEQTIESHEGICFAKAHLLATILRGMGIPAGFCYQRVLRKGTLESGYALHGLNAIFLEEIGWFRVDPRGNKPGINSQFSVKEEMLAYPIRTELGEIDYPNVFVHPLISVVDAMKSSKNTQELFFNRPQEI